jgi:MFS family permease
MIPPALPILLAAFPDNKKGFAVGLVVTLASAFMILGPMVGGFFSEYLGWRYIFWINLPISFIALLLTLLFVPKSPPTKRHFELLGFSCYTLGIIFLTIALIQIQSWGWNSFSTFVLIFLGVVFLLLLYFTDKKSRGPFIDFSLFKNKVFNESALNIFSTAFTLMITIFLSIYMQRIFSFSPAKTGYYLMLSSIPVAVSPIAGKMLDYWGLRKTIIPIQLVLIFSFLSIAFFVFWNNFWLFFPFLFLLSAGMTSIFTCSFAAGLGSVELKNRGEASGLLGTIRALGVNFGVAIVGSLIVDSQKNIFARELSENETTSSLSPKMFDGLMEASAQAKEALESLSFPLKQIVLDIFNRSYKLAFVYASIVEATVILICLIATLLFLKKQKK